MTLHSQTGASSADRWQACSGYLYLMGAFPALGGVEKSEPDYRREGTAAHSLAQKCLLFGTDAWYYAGETIDKTEVGEEIDPADVQVYLDECRQYMKDGWKWFIETPVGKDEATRPHPGFYGTVDFAAITRDKLVVRDLKFGEGIFVEAEDNDQIKYYAYGILLEWRRAAGALDLPPDMVVDLGIVQPRYYGEEKIRTWETTIGALMEWGDHTLIPNMHTATEKAKAAMEGSPAEVEYVAGDHCRFCPRKLVCPLLVGLFRTASVLGADEAGATRQVKAMTDLQLGLEYTQREAVKFYLKAVEEETFDRLSNGRVPYNTKLVPKKANRVWKSGADDMFKAKYGAAAMTTPEMKSPAKMEEVAGRSEVAKWAFTPQTGMTVALADDRRTGVKIPDLAETFAHYLPATASEKVSENV